MTELIWVPETNFQASSPVSFIAVDHIYKGIPNARKKEDKNKLLNNNKINNLLFYLKSNKR